MVIAVRISTAHSVQDGLIAYNPGHPRAPIRTDATTVEPTKIPKGYLVCTFLNGKSIGTDSMALYDGIIINRKRS